MRVVAVAILAGAMLSACGVGADEDPSVVLMGTSTQQLTQATPAPVPPGLEGQTREETGAPGSTGPVDPAAVGIPQDPIPLWQGRAPTTSAPPPPGAVGTTSVTNH